MATSTSGTSAAKATTASLSFDDFVDAALGAAIRATQKNLPGVKPGHLPYPIWVGIIAGPIDAGRFGGGGQGGVGGVG
jgi:hypothetical protein